MAHETFEIVQKVIKRIRERDSIDETPQEREKNHEFPIQTNIQGFSSFRENHAKVAAALIKLLISKELHELNTFLKELPDHYIKHVHPHFMLYTLSAALAHRPDTYTVQLPPVWQYSVRKFFQTDVLLQLLQNKTNGPVIVEPTETGTIVDPEHKVAYFREDLGMNSHHYHWHLVFPWQGTTLSDGRLTFKDREGELFYYMHEQMLARYDAERLSNGLPRVLPLENFRDPIQEGYAPFLTGMHERPYSMRPAGLIIRDIPETSVNTMERWRERLCDAIHEGFFTAPGGINKIPVDIVKLGAAVESSLESPNRGLYGNIHNMGHVMTSMIQDPDSRYKTYNGPMGEPETAARDPIFFRWHKFIDDIFVTHKLTLEPYTDSDLTWDDMAITNAEVTIGEEKNTLHTFWDTREIDLKQAIDIQFPQDDAAKVSVTYLNHTEFEYNIKVKNATGKNKKCTVRIFCAPRKGSADESLHKDLDLQRRLFIELDKFVEDVKPGDSTITRKSTESSVTIPPPATYEELVKPAAEESSTKKREVYCGCGWPQNLLIPKGTTAGLEMDLFVMLTDWTKDQVGESLDCLCKKNHASYCGIKDKKYPDKQAMGFPFDRPMPASTNGGDMTLSEFCERTSNMWQNTVKIQFGEKPAEK